MGTIESKDTKVQTKPTGQKWKKRMLQWFGFSNEPVIKVYHGYSNGGHFIIFGHVFSFHPTPRKTYRNNFLINFFYVFRLFMMKPVGGAHVRIKTNNEWMHTTAMADGFIMAEWQSATPFKSGWHSIDMEWVKETGEVIATGQGSVLVPHSTQLGFISDVDDTFLISYASNIRKRLMVLLWNNPRKRKAFEGVAEHYRLLMHSQTKDDLPNPFFYVSSSEWNLYDYLVEFHRVNELPEGIFLLNRLKAFRDIIRSGQGHHTGKYDRIERILKTYPQQRFVLLGDSGQRDPEIYATVVEKFPGRIKGVYIRDVHKRKRDNVKSILATIEKAGIPCCFYEHSKEAIEHSRRVGLIG